MSYVSNPTDTIVPTTGISFSTLKNTFGPEGSYPVSFSNYMIGVMGNIGQTTSLSSFRGKNLPDPVLNVALTANVSIYGNQYEPLDTTIALNANFRFNKRFFRRFSVQGVAVTIASNRFDATLVNFLANGVSSSIVGGAATGTGTFERTTPPISVTVRKRNGIVKTVYSATADASDTLTSMFAKFDVLTAKSTLTYSNTHHGYHHVLHHDQAHHHGGGNQNNNHYHDSQGNPGHLHHGYQHHQSRGQWRHPNSAVGRNPHVPDQRGSHNNRAHGHHGNRDHGHHYNRDPGHSNNNQQGYGHHHHKNHNDPGAHHNHGAYHHNDPVHHHNHAHHSHHHHINHSHAYTQSSGTAQILENGSDLPSSVFTLTVTPHTGLAGSCANQRTLVEVSDRFDQIGDYVAGCTSRYTLSVRPNWTTTSYISEVKGIAL